MKKVICIVGPTGVGKTELALFLAKKLNGTLISADSIHVFKGLDIISGKDKPEKKALTPLLLDILPPTKSFSAFEFTTEARKKITEIFEKQKTPIIVGGTGLYIKALTDGLDENVMPNMKLRLQLEKLSIEKLQKMLSKLDKKKFDSLNKSDTQNPRRLIRSIEISSSQSPITNHQLPKLAPITIGLYASTEVLKQRIDERVQKRIAQGALKEAEVLYNNYAKLTPQVKNANGYKQLFAYFSDEVSLDEAIYRWKVAEHRHAKNQMTWFRKYGNVVWFDIEKNHYKYEIENYLSSTMERI